MKKCSIYRGVNLIEVLLCEVDQKFDISGQKACLVENIARLRGCPPYEISLYSLVANSLDIWKGSEVF